MAHDKDIKEVNTFTYLGDVLSSSEGYQENLDTREDKEKEIKSRIMSIFKSFSLGYFYFQKAFMLREYLFLNGILTNIESEKNRNK